MTHRSHQKAMVTQVFSKPLPSALCSTQADVLSWHTGPPSALMAAAYITYSHGRGMVGAGGHSGDGGALLLEAAHISWGEDGKGEQ